ncbi:MAG: Ig-like domain-containing protein [Coriobacteriia bacterium]|nr:Ig-like domain-containing protein [Coriobacteriia bacterium]
MTRTVRRFVVVLVVALALFGIFASTALAALEDTPTPTLGTSKTNPSWGVDAWWRGGWGNSLYPEFTLNPPPMTEDTDGYLIGFLYAVDRSLVTPIDTTHPGNYYRADWPVATGATGGTSTDHTIDMLGVYQNPPAGGWRAQLPAEHTPLEGWWVFHYKFFSNFRYAANQWDPVFGIDQTPPRAVTGLNVTTGLTSSTVTTWTPATRAHITWNPGDLPGQYDDLSGIGYYQVMLDDKPYVPETSSSPTLGRVYGSQAFVIAPSFTIENMPAGAHKISIVPVDRATNPGPAASQMFYSDPDTPTISFTSPTTSILSMKSIFSVDASDAAGPPVVTMALDGSGLTTLTAAPYSYKPDLSALGSGTHTLTATATDHLGRTVTITKTVSFSNTITSAGFMTTGPSELVDLSPDADIWTNNVHPSFALATGSEIATLEADSGGTAAGMLYDLRRVLEPIDASTPDAYYRSWRPGAGDWATHMDATVDLGSVMAYPPPGGWPAPEPGVEQPVEGIWYLQYKGFLDNGWAESATNYVKFGVDVTPPSTVDSLAASPTTDTAMAGSVTAGTRVHITWLTKDYDALSGVAYYQVLLDGVPAIPEGSGDPQGRVFDIPGRAEPAVTIENLTPGQHLIEVYAVDRAGNVGKSVSTTVFSDPDVPQIAFVRPSGDQLGVNASLEASASDIGGVKSVVFQLDGTTVLTKTSAPYSGTADLSAFGPGTHTLTATVTDMYGRQTSVSKQVTLDKTPLTISGFGINYTLFYPIKRDKYRDNLTISFTTSKVSSARVLVTNSSGAVVRTLTKSAIAGKNSLTWDGKWSADNKAHTGTFYIQVTATDSSGNFTATGKLKTAIKNYQIIVSRGKAKVISR